MPLVLCREHTHLVNPFLGSYQRGLSYICRSTRSRRFAVTGARSRQLSPGALGYPICDPIERVHLPGIGELNPGGKKLVCDISVAETNQNSIDFDHYRESGTILGHMAGRCCRC
jgi:hypothetical protein